MEKTINGKTCIEIGQAARMLETTIPRLLMLLKQGKLAGELVDGEWYVESQTLMEMIGVDMPPVTSGSCGHGCAGCSGC